MKPDIVRTFENEGIELKPYGADRLVCHCPLHQEKTASCVLSRGRNRFHCFGCGRGGDAYAFIMAYKGFTFKEAKKYLDGEDYASQDEYALRRAKSEARREFREWCEEAKAVFLQLNVGIHDVLNNAPSIDYIEGRGYTDHVRNLAKYDHWLDILLGHNDKSKLELYRQSRGY